MDYTRVINYDKRQGDSHWAGITTTEFVAPEKCGEKVHVYSLTDTPINRTEPSHSHRKNFGNRMPPPNAQSRGDQG